MSFAQKKTANLSVTKLVEKLQAHFHYTIEEINAVFIPRLSVKRNSYDQLSLTVAGLVLVDSGKKVALSYEKIVELFGFPLKINVSESPKRKVIPSLQTQMLKISTEQSTFTPKDKEETNPKKNRIAFYPSIIATAPVELSKKLVKSMNDYIASQSEEATDEDLEEAEFL